MFSPEEDRPESGKLLEKERRKLPFCLTLAGRPGKYMAGEGMPKASHPCCRSCQAREISPWMSSASGSGSAGSRTGAVSAAGDCSVLVLMASRISSTVRSRP